MLRDVVTECFPDLVNPDLTRRARRRHWRKTRNKSRREKAAALLVEQKPCVIDCPIIHGHEDIPLVEICDEDLDICISKEFETVDIEVSHAELLSYDIEITGEYQHQDLVKLASQLIGRIADNL